MTEQEKKQLSEENLLAWLRNYVAENPVPVIKKMRPGWVGLCVDRARKEFFLLPEQRTYNKSHSRLLAGDVTDEELPQLLFSSWELYRYICFYGETVPVMYQYYLMICISAETANSWKNERTRKLSGASEAIKRALEDTEAALLSECIENNSIGAIFALKAGFGYSDKGNQVYNIRNEARPERMTAEEIQRRIESMEEEQ